MTENDVQERKGIRRLQNVLVVAVFLLLSAVAVRMLLIDEPQRWRETEKDVALSTFSEAVSLVRAEWLRQGKPAVVALFERADSPAGFVKVNKSGWPSVDNGCLGLWRKLGGEIPASALSVKREGNRCYYALNDKAWFWFDAGQGRIQREKHQ